MINDEEVNLLKFRDEYIKLLKKYDVELEANEIGQIQLYTQNGNSYLLSGLNNGIYKNDKNLMSDFIVNSFGNNRNNIVKRDLIGIISNDKEKVEDLLLEIKEKNKNNVSKYYINNTDGYIRLADDGTEFVWHKYTMNVRGACFKKAIIDCDIHDLDKFIDCVVYGCCRFCRKEDISIF